MHRAEVTDIWILRILQYRNRSLVAESVETGSRV